MRHATVDVHSLKIGTWLLRHRDIRKNKCQFTGELLVFLGAGQPKDLPEGGMKQAIQINISNAEANL